MLLLLPLLRRVSIRTRIVLGALLTVLGLVGLAVGLVILPGLVLQAAIALFVGTAFLSSAWASTHRVGARVALHRR